MFKNLWLILTMADDLSFHKEQLGYAQPGRGDKNKSSTTSELLFYTYNTGPHSFCRPRALSDAEGNPIFGSLRMDSLRISSCDMPVDQMWTIGPGNQGNYRTVSRPSVMQKGASSLAERDGESGEFQRIERGVPLSHGGGQGQWGRGGSVRHYPRQMTQGAPVAHNLAPGTPPTAYPWRESQDMQPSFPKTSSERYGQRRTSGPPTAFYSGTWVDTCMPVGKERRLSVPAYMHSSHDHPHGESSLGNPMKITPELIERFILECCEMLTDYGPGHPDGLPLTTVVTAFTAWASQSDLTLIYTDLRTEVASVLGRTLIEYNGKTTVVRSIRRKNTRFYGLRLAPAWRETPSMCSNMPYTSRGGGKQAMTDLSSAQSLSALSRSMSALSITGEVHGSLPPARGMAAHTSPPGPVAASSSCATQGSFSNESFMPGGGDYNATNGTWGQFNFYAQDDFCAAHSAPTSPAAITGVDCITAKGWPAIAPQPQPSYELFSTQPDLPAGWLSVAAPSTDCDVGLAGKSDERNSIKEGMPGGSVPSGGGDVSEFNDVADSPW